MGTQVCQHLEVSPVRHMWELGPLTLRESEFVLV